MEHHLNVPTSGFATIANYFIFPQVIPQVPDLKQVCLRHSRDSDLKFAFHVAAKDLKS